ncbi:MAG: glycoside hydrolase family 2 protein, partial [Clostridia bacterium]
VRLATSDDRIRYSDNYFSLLPGDNKVVRLLRCQETPTVSAVRFTPNAATQYTSNARRNNP